MTTKQRVKFVVRNGIRIGACAGLFVIFGGMTLSIVDRYYAIAERIVGVVVPICFGGLAASGLFMLFTWSIQPD